MYSFSDIMQLCTGLVQTGACVWSDSQRQDATENVYNTLNSYRIHFVWPSTCKAKARLHSTCIVYVLACMHDEPMYSLQHHAAHRLGQARGGGGDMGP